MGCKDVIAIIEKAEGNAMVGTAWFETKVFPSSTPVEEIVSWSRRAGNKGKLIITVDGDGVRA